MSCCHCKSENVAYVFQVARCADCGAETWHTCQCDQLRAEVERLKAELHDTIESYKLNNLQPKTVRPEPSRLEIAAMLKAGWFANPEAEIKDDQDSKWWIEQADALIAAAKEGGK